MFCVHCGSKLENGQTYCSVCGKPAGFLPVIPPQSRLAGHLRLLGIFWVAISALRLLGAGVLFVIAGLHFPEVPRHVGGMVASILQTIGMFVAASALGGFLAGWGLLTRQSWARVLALVMGCLSLLDVPLGTALGVYTLWVLLPGKSQEEYREMLRVT